MHARLGGHQSVGVVAGERHRHALDTGLLAGLEVDDLALEAATLRPFRVHAQEHLGPVLRLGAAGAGMDGDDRVRSIVLAAEHLLGLGRLHLPLQLVEPALEVGADVLPAVRPFDEHREVVQTAAQRLAQRDVVFDATTPLHHLLRVGLVVPEGRAGGDLLDLG